MTKALVLFAESVQAFEFAARQPQGSVKVPIEMPA